MKPSEKWLYSVVGIIALLVILLGLNVAGSYFKVRSDLTANRLYTLSPGTKKILDKLDTDVEIRFYYSRDNAAVPVPLRTYAQQVEDLLAEYRQAGHGKIKVLKLDPKPDSDAEDSANLDGIQGQTFNLADKVYLGIAVSCLDAKTALPFLSPDRENLLEYDLSRAISSVANPKKAVIGVMSALPVTGRQSSPMMMMQRQATERPYVFLTELKESYEVRDVPLTAAKIDEDISVLLVDYPKGISPQALFAIDQYVLRGGKLVALLDPLSFVDAQTSGQQEQMMGGAVTSASLDPLLGAWGLKFTANQIVNDPAFATQVQREAGVLTDASILSVNADGINKTDPLGAATSDLLLPFVGAFSGTPVEGVREEVLVKSSPQAGLVSAASAQMGAEAARKEYKPGKEPLPLALRLTGRFKTAYPGGRPASKPGDPTDSAPTPAPSPTASATGEVLKEGKADGVVILVGDSDFAYDGIAGRSQQVLSQTVFVPSNGNLNFIQSAIEQLAGDANLIGIRSRASASRPFVMVNQMEAAAEQRYQSKIDELENNLADARQKLADLQDGKQTDQKAVLSPEQQGEIRKFQENEGKINRELKQVRKDLRSEIDSLQDGIKWFDIAAMPAVVTVAGLGLAVWKRRRRAVR
ncbi:MAG TPA: Gldg family protein [Chthoniobacterales bacterium]